MANGEPRVGGEIDAWCGRCKLLLNHTVVALYEGRVRRVLCLTCRGQHAYRDTTPGPRAAPAGRRRAVPAGVLEGPTRAYSTEQTYATGELIQHPQHGRGRVAEVRGNKIDVSFTDGPRTLVHGRPRPV